MQVCPFTSLPAGMNAIYVLCKQQYVLCRKIAEHIKASLSNHKRRDGTIRWKMVDSDEGSKWLEPA